MYKWGSEAPTEKILTKKELDKQEKDKAKEQKRRRSKGSTSSLEEAMGEVVIELAPSPIKKGESKMKRGRVSSALLSST